MRVIVASVHSPFVRHRADDLAHAVVQALNTGSHQTESVAIPFNPSDPARIPDQMLACRLINLSEADRGPVNRLITINFPAYLVDHPHKVVVVNELFPPAYELWEQKRGDLFAHPEGKLLSDTIRAADAKVCAEAHAIATDSPATVEQIRRHWHIDPVLLTARHHVGRGNPVIDLDALVRLLE